jgi:RNA polymerase sigma-70 factor (ECF subfamily)
MNRAVEHALRGYGPEFRRLMAAILRDEGRVQDAFSLFCECLLKGLPDFRWESSFRTWANRMARNCCYKVVNAPAVRHKHVSLSALPERPVARHSSTNPWLRTTMKDRFRSLRERLDPQEQRLLVLRVEQRLPWPEVVQMMSEPGESMTCEMRTRKATAMRQQFQRIKTRLRSLAIAEGLLALKETGS